MAEVSRTNPKMAFMIVCRSTPTSNSDHRALTLAQRHILPIRVCSHIGTDFLTFLDERENFKRGPKLLFHMLATILIENFAQF